MELQTASRDIFNLKYALKNTDGELVETEIDQTLRRVAHALASVEPTEELKEKCYIDFYEALQKGAIPAGRILSNAGATDFKPNTSLINCVVSETIEDSVDGIFRAVHRAAKSLSAGCGIGYCFSTLRPKGAFVNGVGATTSGTLSFMDVFDKMCFTIASAGGRRG